ncbi:MAG: hypothetical protein ACRDKI_06095 [Solirubrobacterales bacterium]
MPEATAGHELQPPSVKTVRGVVTFAVLATAIHFTDNTLNIQDYPAASWQPDWFEYIVAASWFVFTAIGTLGYRYYRDGNFPKAHLFLGVYSITGFVTLGHFTTATPGELTTFGLVTVLIDAIVGIVVLSTVVWSIRARREPAAV